MSRNKKNLPPVYNLIAGGGAGLAEALSCHPLDTIKVRMQLRSSTSKGVKLNMFQSANRIIVNEGFFALYKGLGAVVSGIVPKMAIRFTSYDLFREWLTPASQKPAMLSTFLAGLLAGVTEAVMVVTPMDVLKIRMQAQRHSMADPLEARKYKNTFHAAYLIVREEGFPALYRGVGLTVARQATNQAVNFTAYEQMKDVVLKWQKTEQLYPWQSLLLGGLSGAMGPIANAPIDTIKTRIQKEVRAPGDSAMTQMRKCITKIYVNEGWRAFYKGLTPRVLRVAPGQAVTFMMYEKISQLLEWKFPIASKTIKSTA